MKRTQTDLRQSLSDPSTTAEGAEQKRGSGRSLLQHASQAATKADGTKSRCERVTICNCCIQLLGPNRKNANVDLSPWTLQSAPSAPRETKVLARPRSTFNTARCRRCRPLQGCSFNRNSDLRFMISPTWIMGLGTGTRRICDEVDEDRGGEVGEGCDDANLFRIAGQQGQRTAPDFWVRLANVPVLIHILWTAVHRYVHQASKLPGVQ